MKPVMKSLITSTISMMLFAVPNSAFAKITLVNYFRGYGNLTKIWQDVTDAFEKKHPNIDVKILNVPYQEYFTKLETMIAAGTAPDMVFMESTWFPHFARKKLVRDMSDLIRREKNLRPDDFFPEALDLFTYKGRLYGLPNDLAIYCNAFNKNLFSQAGLKEPTEDWTSGDLLQMAKRLTRDINGDGRPDQFGINWLPYEAVIYANGGHIADNPDNPSKSILNRPESIEAIDWLASLYLQHKVVGGDFNAGKAAIGTIGHWDIPQTAKLAKFKWDTVGMPRFKRRATMNFGSAFMIPSNSKHPREAWELVKFYAGVEGQTILAKEGFGTPALRKIAESEAYLAQRPPENQRAFTNAIGYSVKRPFTSQWDKVISTMDTEFNKVFTGKTSARAACETAVTELNKIFIRDFSKNK